MRYPVLLLCALIAPAISYAQPTRTPVRIAIEDALFLHSEMLRSPMGANLTAFRRDAITPIALVDSFGGVVLSWDEVLDHVRRNGHTHAHDGAIQAGALPASGHDVHSRHAGVEHTVDQAGPP